ncbi:MAG: GTPase HflX [Candidatus Anoxychlamydiales bacterium]|nr:GTPase HflX [Candidatus Anoxychlamydiales bacterium]
MNENNIFQQTGRTRLLELTDNKNALLIGAFEFPKDKGTCIENLEELNSLSDTFGLDTIDKISVHLRKIESSTYLGSGKVQEIADIVNEKDIVVVIFDMDIAPHQQRNLEKKIKVAVIDRTELILSVFAIHAKTKEANMQIKLAQFKYEYPRLKRMWTHLSRQRTGGASGGFLKGEGEKQIEIDRRILKTKISKISSDIKDIKKQRELNRKQREKAKIPTFAIVGYTNAGKSTLMNALTNANVLVEDKLFATLDTTTRRYILSNQQQILLIDTVGFIRKLPHLLIASFRSTLEEITFADILIHLVDVSSKAAMEHTKQSYQILKELNAENIPIITVLNKVDKLENKSIITYFKLNYPNVIAISALEKKGLDELEEKIEETIASIRKIVKLKIPQSYYKLVAALIKDSRVISTDYDANDIILEIEIPKMIYSKVSQFEI